MTMPTLRNTWPLFAIAVWLALETFVCAWAVRARMIYEPATWERV